MTPGRSRATRRAAFVAGLLLTGLAAAQPPYPEIRQLRSEDLIYAQLEDSVQRYYASEKSGEAPPELSIYSYTTTSPVDLFSLAAALSLPYDSLATLNRLADPGTIAKGRRILVPSIPGLFVSARPENDLEYLIKSLRADDPGRRYPVRVLAGAGELEFMFYPGSTFMASERSFFLVSGFRFPLPRGVISSGFGMRSDPVNARLIKFHPGIDIAAPQGTEVYAARSGRVEEAGWSEVYGNYVLIAHDNDWESLYGHLSSISVTVGQHLQSGSLVGKVGSTGISTGPHLHFEIHKRGVAENPLNLLAPTSPGAP